FPCFPTMAHCLASQGVGNGFLGDVFAPGSWSISAEVFLYLIYIAMARPIYRFLNSEQVILLIIGALVALVSLFYVGKAAGWWYAPLDFSYPNTDPGLFYDPPLAG